MLNLTISINRIYAYITGLFNYLQRKENVHCIYNQKVFILPDKVSPIIAKAALKITSSEGQMGASNDLLKIGGKYINEKDTWSTGI